MGSMQKPLERPVGGQDDGIALTGANEAEAPLTLVQPALARADIALHAPVGEPLPEAGRVRLC